jgi:cation diffusion facilitator CzcD-associated flavoprotein CzcO
MNVDESDPHRYRRPVTDRRDVDVLVIGAGFAGLRTLYTMRGLGMSVAGPDPAHRALVA